MRILLVGFFTMAMVAACSDVAPVSTTVVHINLSASGCGEADCSPFHFGNDLYCGGPYSETAITPTTTHLEVSTDDDAKELVGYVQLQYENVGNGSYHEEYPLLDGDRAQVISPYSDEPLYFLTAAGEPADIATDKLMNRDGSTLTFAYDHLAASVVEVHHIDAPRVVHVETSSPGWAADTCCSVGRPQDGALLVLALVGGLRLGRRRAKR